MKQFLYAINALSFSFLIKLKMIHKCDAASFVFLPTDRILIILKLKADDAKFLKNIYGRKTYSHSFPVFLNGIFLKLFRIFHPFSSRSGFFFFGIKKRPSPFVTFDRFPCGFSTVRKSFFSFLRRIPDIYVSKTLKTREN